MLAGVCMGLPGVALAIANEPTSVVWEGSEGYADLGRRIPLANEDRFCVGSITKTIVATIVLQLVDNGLLDLEMTISTYLTDPATKKMIDRVPNAGIATLRQERADSSPEPSPSCNNTNPVPPQAASEPPKWGPKLGIQSRMDPKSTRGRGRPKPYTSSPSSKPKRIPLTEARAQASVVNEWVAALPCPSL